MISRSVCYLLQILLQFAKPISIVIVGKDTRKKGSSLNTDVIMVIVLNPKDKKITMVSIPRDTKEKYRV
ncbi:LCP family protein [Brevibacillus halotolerans]|uniref:LCP family glycopolymer transferase n=1 Tax=Brevibacillus halotolerans TaxID=1507437 RepID=UPI003D180B58